MLCQASPGRLAALGAFCSKSLENETEIGRSVLILDGFAARLGHPVNVAVGLSCSSASLTAPCIGRFTSVAGE